MQPAADPTRFILLNTSHGGNVGAAARAIKVMGFGELVLVQPRFADVLVREDTIAFASGAADVLAATRVVGSLAEALEGVTHACATAMTPRDFGAPAQAPRDALPALARQPHRMAFVFGSERHGMANEDVWRCHSVLSIPTHPDYGSLNLAQAVQLIAYEWRQCLGAFGVVTATSAPQWAGAGEVQGTLAHWRSALEAIGYLDPKAPKKLMPRLNQLANRLALTREEVHILRGIARAMLKSAQATDVGVDAAPAAPASRD
ncbi:MAG: RNA methyltransferase [Betaproteobacteria bacterium]|jgi:tRNA/rRNA methyltransferase